MATMEPMDFNEWLMKVKDTHPNLNLRVMASLIAKDKDWPIGSSDELLGYLEDFLNGPSFRESEELKEFMRFSALGLLWSYNGESGYKPRFYEIVGL